MNPNKPKSNATASLGILGIWIAALLVAGLGALLASQIFHDGFDSLMLVVVDPIIFIAVIVFAVIFSKRLSRDVTENKRATNAATLTLLFAILGTAAGQWIWSSAAISPKKTIIPLCAALVAMDILVYILASRFVFYSTDNKRFKIWRGLILISMLVLPSLVFYSYAKSDSRPVFDPVCCGLNQIQ